MPFKNIISDIVKYNSIYNNYDIISQIHFQILQSLKNIMKVFMKMTLTYYTFPCIIVGLRNKSFGKLKILNLWFVRAWFLNFLCAMIPGPDSSVGIFINRGNAILVVTALFCYNHAQLFVMSEIFSVKKIVFERWSYNGTISPRWHFINTKVHH